MSRLRLGVQRARDLDGVPARHADVRVVRVPTLLGYRGMALGEVVLLVDGLDTAAARRVLAHELVHVDQWRRLGKAGFARRYLTEYVRHRRRGIGHRSAYASISLEREARGQSSMTMPVKSSSASG